jgi:hypothetical protein
VRTYTYNTIYILDKIDNAGPAKDTKLINNQVQFELVKHFLITLYQEQAVFGKIKMDPAKQAQTQNAGKVSSLQWFFSQSVELMTDKVWLHCIRPMLLK